MDLRSMQPKTDQNSSAISTSTACAEPWWRNLGYSHISPTMVGGNISLSSQPEHPNSGLESKNEGDNDGDNGNDDDDDKDNDDDGDAEDSDNIASPLSEGQEHHYLQRGASTIHSRDDGSLAQPPQLELVGHSIACASNSFPDPYYGGMMAAYGPQSLVNPYFVGLHQARMPLPLEMAQEPVYVNAKQYHGILRRRQSRAKAELERKLVKARKPYLHESRHQHAMRRARGSGGRFAKKANADDSALKTKEGTGSGAATTSSLSASSSGSEPLRAASAEAWNSSGSVCYSNHGGSQATMYDSRKNERQEKGDVPWGTVASDQNSQRALAMQ